MIYDFSECSEISEISESSESSACLLSDLAAHHSAVTQAYGAVCGQCQLFVVGDDDEGLSQFASQVEEELV